MRIEQPPGGFHPLQKKLFPVHAFHDICVEKQDSYPLRYGPAQSEALGNLESVMTADLAWREVCTVRSTTHINSDKSFRGLLINAINRIQI